MIAPINVSAIWFSASCTGAPFTYGANLPFFIFLASRMQLNSQPVHSYGAINLIHMLISFVILYKYRQNK